MGLASHAYKPTYVGLMPGIYPLEINATDVNEKDF
jgi:hypothetical protein